MPGKLSPINFRAPLLKALARLSGGKAEAPVVMDQTYAPIMQEMGISSLDQYGMAPGTSQTWVVRWTGFAFKGMKSAGLTEAPKRGAWALTAKGLDVARKLIDGSLVTVPMGGLTADDTDEAVEPAEEAPMVSPSPAPVAPVSVIEAQAGAEPMPEPPVSAPVSVVVPAPVPVAKPVKTPENGVILPVGPGLDTGTTYHTDPYIIGLAIQGTPCFGNYSNRSDMCATCAFRQRCINALASSLTALSSAMRKQDEELEKARAKAAAQGKTAPAGGSDPNLSALLDDMVPTQPKVGFRLAGRRTETIKVMAASKCLRCGGEIKMNEQAAWIPPVEGGETGSLHLHCVKDPD